MGRVDGLESEGILSVSLVPELGLWREVRVLLAEEVSEVGDGVIGVANEGAGGNTSSRELDCDLPSDPAGRAYD